MEFRKDFLQRCLLLLSPFGYWFNPQFNLQWMTQIIDPFSNWSSSIIHHSFHTQNLINFRKENIYINLIWFEWKEFILSILSIFFFVLYLYKWKLFFFYVLLTIAGKKNKNPIVVLVVVLLLSQFQSKKFFVFCFLFFLFYCWSII